MQSLLSSTRRNGASADIPDPSVVLSYKRTSASIRAAVILRRLTFIMKIRPIHIVAALVGLWILVWVFFEMFPAKEKQPSAASGPGGIASAPSAPAPDFPLKKEDIKVGTGAEATDGKTVQVHYTGTLTDGSKFDSSRDKGQPFEFTLGAGQVIKGWDQGVKGMREGGRRKLTVPPALGYGAAGAGGTIPPNAVLLFDIELLKVK
jgi:FKBP-type peptidyl-prolyl cis-trans isomerase FkpA